MLEKNKKNFITELYPAIQGEGKWCGHPVIVIRVSGCTHRCYFGEGGWCDSWYCSWYPQGANFCFNDVIDMCKKYPYIKEFMLTGGSPTLYPDLIYETLLYAHANDMKVTMESEGSMCPSNIGKDNIKIDLLSLSPKFSNSVPKLGTLDPRGNKVTQQVIDQHNKYRLNKEAISQLIQSSIDYQYKPVWDGTEENLKEIEDFRVNMNIPKEKTWLMPAGDNREQLIKVYPDCINKCIELGYNFSGREHIIAFDKKLGV